MNEELLKKKRRAGEIGNELKELAQIENKTEEQAALEASLLAEGGKIQLEIKDLEKAEDRAAVEGRAQELIDLSKQGGRVTSPAAPGATFSRQRMAIEDDPRRGFKTFGHFAAQVMHSHAAPQHDPMLMHVAAGTGMSQGITDSGGVLIPPAFSKMIWDGVLRQVNSMLGYCFQMPVDPGVESVTIPAIAESSRANGSRYGGIQGYWKDELTAMSETKPTFRQVKLTPHELYVFAYISDKLLRHSPGTASALLEKAAADEIAFKIGDAIVNGTGVGQPRGIVGHPGTKSVAKETGQAAATILPKNLSKMRAALHPNWRQGAVWFINSEVETALEAMEFPVGTGGVPAFLPPGGVSATPYSTLYGKPLIPIEYCAALGTVGDIIHCNLSAYAAAVRGMVDSQYSIHLKFDYAQTAFRMIFEMDGQPFLNSVITPYKGTLTQSPIVTLDTRA